MNPSVKHASCRSCGATIIWMRSSKGKNVPVNPDTVDEADLEWFEPSNTVRDWTPKFVYGTHIAHFTTCPNAAQHRGSGGKSSNCSNCERLERELAEARAEINRLKPAGLRTEPEPEYDDDDVPF